MKKKYLITIGLGFLLLPLLICVISFLPKRRPDVSLGTLLMSESIPIQQWNTGTGTVSVNWQINKNSFSLKDDNAFYSISNLGRIWTDGNNINPRLAEHIFQYKNPVTAMLHYWLSRPEIAYRNDWPNFTDLENQQALYPINWRFDNSHADQENIVCAMGVPTSCQTLYYWARYGQYILLVEFFAPNEGIDVLTFQKIVERMDFYIGQQLEN